MTNLKVAHRIILNDLTLAVGNISKQTNRSTHVKNTVSQTPGIRKITDANPRTKRHIETHQSILSTH